jgi:Asp-tRNA(Asn)/Glu-tRNA(Gln) amidotransferase A subunit family amidase/ketopantoate reductase
LRAVRYLLVGCGAIGGTVAAGLARDGHEILVCDADPAVVHAVSERGLRIEGPVEQFTARLPAVSPDGLPDQVDGPVLLAVKAHHTAAAMTQLAPRLGAGGYVVSLQNGLNTGVIADAVGPDRVVEAFVNFGADMLEPGVVLRGNRGTFVIGEPDGRLSSRVLALAADIADATATDSVLGYLWAKEAYGAQLFATAVSDLPIYAVFEDPAYRDLLIELARQVLAQAPVPAMPFDGFDPADLAGSLARLAAFNRGSAKTHTGVYRDLAILHRPTEAPAILGMLDGPLVRRVAELVAAIEQGRRTCTRANLDLLAAYERLDRLGRPLNAVVQVLGDPARDGAAAGPLAGQPVAVKDIVAVAGVPTGCGSPASDPVPAAFDATLVTRLRDAGAEVLATTQCLEYAAGFAHPAIGDTRNPRDPSRTSGGSSGGSAAVVAAGVCALAIGTDTGGSIRIPAAYCGTVGLKPSYGLIPLDGVFPLAPSCDHAGTLTATVAGTAALLAALADPGTLDSAVLAEAGLPGGGGALDDPGALDDVGTAGAPGPVEARAPDAGQPPATFTVGVLVGQLADPSVTPEVHAAVTEALGALAAAGWDLREVRAPWLDDLPEWERVLTVIVAREAHQVHHLRDTSQYAEGTRALLALGAEVTQEQYAAALARRDELIAAVDASMAGLDALAGPTVGFVAPEQDPPFGVGEDSGEGRFTGPYNLTGQPAIALPVPSAGLPASLQLAGRLGGDAALLRVAAAAEALLSPKAQLSPDAQLSPGAQPGRPDAQP